MLLLIMALNKNLQFIHTIGNTSHLGSDETSIKQWARDQFINDPAFTEISLNDISVEPINALVDECIGKLPVRAKKTLYVIPFRIKNGHVLSAYAVLATDAEEASHQFVKLFQQRLAPCGYRISDVVSYPYIELPSNKEAMEQYIHA